MEYSDPQLEPLKTIIAPGGLDVLSILENIISRSPVNHQEIEYWLMRINNSCGRVIEMGIEATSNGWREDWALIQLSEGP